MYQKRIIQAIWFIFINRFILFQTPSFDDDEYEVECERYRIYWLRTNRWYNDKAHLASFLQVAPFIRAVWE